MHCTSISTYSLWGRSYIPFVSPPNTGAKMIPSIKNIAEATSKNITNILIHRYQLIFFIISSLFSLRLTFIHLLWCDTLFTSSSFSLTIQLVFYINSLTASLSTLAISSLITKSALPSAEV